MEKEHSKLKRRPFLFPLLVPLAAFAVLVVAAMWIWDMRATTVIIVVRHAEAEVSDSNPDPDLTLLGQERAARLARILAKVQGDRGVDVIFASEMKRTQQTVAPLAQAQSLPTNVLPAATWDELPKLILQEQRGKVVLVAGHSNSVPELVKALSGETITLSESDYDHLYVIFAPRLSPTRVLQLRY